MRIYSGGTIAGFTSRVLHIVPSQQNSPSLSVVVVLHNMVRQARNTLHSLSAAYQLGGVSSADYEVIVVENDSGNNLHDEDISKLPGNFQYHLRREESVSPAAAINFGIAQARADFIGVMIDGARMLTPGVIKTVLDSTKAYPNAFVNVPGYYLTAQGAVAEEQSLTDVAGEEQAMLSQCDWQSDGYRLFERAVFSNGNRHGYLRPWFESTAFFVNRWALTQAGGADESFQLAGGGALLLHLFRSLGLIGELEYLVLPGEGNFHQFHSGVSTQSGDSRDALVKQFKQQLDSKWVGGFRALSREPTLVGNVPEQAIRFLKQSGELSRARNGNFYREHKPIWPDDDDLGLFHGEHAQ